MNPAPVPTGTGARPTSDHSLAQLTPADHGGLALGISAELHPADAIMAGLPGQSARPEPKCGTVQGPGPPGGIDEFIKRRSWGSMEPEVSA
jgi:hypothetical protein